MNHKSEFIVRSPDYPSAPLPALDSQARVTPFDAPEGLDTSLASPAMSALWQAQGLVDDVRNGRTLPQHFEVSSLNDAFMLAILREHGPEAAIPTYSHTGLNEAHWQLVCLAQSLIRRGVALQAVQDAVETCITKAE